MWASQFEFDFCTLYYEFIHTKSKSVDQIVFWDPNHLMCMTRLQLTNSFQDGQWRIAYSAPFFTVFVYRRDISIIWWFRALKPYIFWMYIIQADHPDHPDHSYHSYHLTTWPLTYQIIKFLWKKVKCFTFAFGQRQGGWPPPPPRPLIVSLTINCTFDDSLWGDEFFKKKIIFERYNMILHFF